jgi:hypothetical protein
MSQPAPNTPPPPRGGRGDPQIAPARIRTAVPQRGRRHRAGPPRHRLRTAALVTGPGLVAGAVIAAQLPLPGIVAWVIAWAVIAVAVTVFIEFGRRRWLPAAIIAVRGLHRDDGDTIPIRGRRDLPRDDEARPWWRGRADAYDDDDEEAENRRPWQPAPDRPSGAGRAPAGPAGRRSAARQRAALATRQFTVPKTTGGAVSAEASALASKIAEFRTDDGEELEGWLDQMAADMYAIGEAISDAHDGLVNETRLDEIPCAAVHDAADSTVDLGGLLVAAKEKILRYYEDPRNFAESGGKMPAKGDFWEPK